MSQNVIQLSKKGVTSGVGMFSCISDEDATTSHYPFKTRCIVFKDIAPRDDRFEYYLEVGRSDLERLFEQGRITKEALTFIFPERWLTVKEQAALVYLINEFGKDVVKELNIATSSPLIVGSFPAVCVRVISKEEKIQK